jgi:hypothetical protein
MTCAVLVMEVWPSGFAVQAEIPNHCKLRRSRAGVVSVAAKASPGAGQVCDEKTNVCEPLLTHRNVGNGIETGEVHGPGRTAPPRGVAGGQAAACVLAWWCPVYRWRELVVGAGTEQENLSSRYRRPVEMCVVGPLAARGRTRSGGPIEGRVPMRGTGADRPVLAVRAL